MRETEVRGNGRQRRFPGFDPLKCSCGAQVSEVAVDARTRVGAELMGEGDVIISPKRDARDPSRWKMGDYQLAVRFYRPADDSWSVTAISPVHDQVHQLVARKVGDRIVLQGTAPDGTPERWSFNDITAGRCVWRGEISQDGGASWSLDEEMILTRRSPDGNAPLDR